MSTPVKSHDAELNADGKTIPDPTLAEAYFMLNIIKFINGKLDTDWTKVAEAQGLKNAETAKVRFGQIKKKLGFANAGITPRPKAPKRGGTAEMDESGTTPAEKKQRKTPAKSRAKRQQAVAAGGTGALGVSSPTTAGDQSSPLAAKPAKKAANQNLSQIPKSLGDGRPHGVAAPSTTGAGYLNAAAFGSGAASTGKSNKDTNKDNANPKTGTDTKTVIKPDPEYLPEEEDEQDDDEDAANSRAKAALFAQITQQQTLSEPDSSEHPQSSQILPTARHPLPSAAATTSIFGPPNNFPKVNAHAPLNAQQVQATAVRNQVGSLQGHPGGRGGGQPTTATPRQIRDAIAASHTQQGQASTPSLRFPTPLPRGGGHVTTIQAHIAIHGSSSGGRQPDVDEDMTLAASSDGLPPRDDADDEYFSAFNAAMYGAGGGGGDSGGALFEWSSFP